MATIQISRDNVFVDFVQTSKFLSLKLFTCMILADAIFDRSFAQGVFYRYKLRAFCDGSFKFLTLNLTKKGLPHPSGPLSTIIPALSIDAADVQGSKNDCY